MFNGQPLQLGGNIVVLNETTIVFSSLNRNNAGNYSILATNVAGTGRADFSLDVFCKLWKLENDIIVVVIFKVETEFKVSMLLKDPKRGCYWGSEGLLKSEETIGRGL